MGLGSRVEDGPELVLALCLPILSSTHGTAFHPIVQRYFGPGQISLGAMQHKRVVHCLVALPVPG